MRSALLLLCALLLCPCSLAAEWTQADLLQRMLDVDRLCDPPSPGERPLLFSSYDRSQATIKAGRYTSWDGENDSGQFYGRDGKWDVLADIQGPGIVHRIWIDKPVGRFRLEIDGREVFSDKFAALFDGSLAPFGKPLSYAVGDGDAGSNLYFPIGFGQRLRLLTRDFKGRYQIDASQHSGQAIRSFRPQLDEPSRAALDEVIKAFRNGLQDADVLRDRSTMTVAWQQDVKPGEKAVETFDEGGTIRALYVSLTDRTAPRELYALHKCVIRITWDDGKQPDIELPLAAFFGSGFDRNPYNSLVMGTDRWLDLPGLFPTESYFMYCLLPMPFSKARIEIENRNEKSIGLMLYMRVEPQTPGANRMRLRTTFRVEDPCKTFDYPLLQARGPGRVVGCVLNIDTPRDDAWDRGDHKVWLGNESFPSILGTGTSDYFGLPALTEKANHPLHGASLVNQYGKNSRYRWHLGDSLTFQQQIRFTIENWQEKQQDDVYYNSIVYWYGPTGSPDTTERLRGRDLALPGLRIPGAIEVEGNVRGEKWGRVLRQKYAGGVELSGEAGANISSKEPVTVSLPVETSGRYALSLRVHPGRSFRTIQIQLPERTEPFTIEWNRDSDGIYPLGEVDFERGIADLQITCDRPAVLDCWILTPLDGDG